MKNRSIKNGGLIAKKDLHLKRGKSRENISIIEPVLINRGTAATVVESSQQLTQQSEPNHQNGS